MALLSRDPLRPGVSVELNTCYLAPLPLNDTAVIKAR